MKYLIYGIGGALAFFIAQVVLGGVMTNFFFNDLGVALLASGQFILALLVICVGVYLSGRISRLEHKNKENEENEDRE